MMVINSKLIILKELMISERQSRDLLILKKKILFLLQISRQDLDTFWTLFQKNQEF